MALSCQTPKHGVRQLEKGGAIRQFIATHKKSQVLREFDGVWCLAYWEKRAMAASLIFGIFLMWIGLISEYEDQVEVQLT